MELAFSKIDSGSPNIEEVKDLFETAFPEDERPPFEMTLSFKGSDFFAIYENKAFIGLADLVIYGETVYLFFFEIKEELRGKGYGSHVLQELFRRFPNKKVFLLAEEIDGDYEDLPLRKRRIGFYERNGFVLSDTRIKEFGVDYRLLYHGGVVDKKDFLATMRSILDEEIFKAFYSNI